jgi:HPt (histidine-containing phosphotransfer) domain-containing protein
VFPTEEVEPLVDPDLLRELTEFRVPGEPDPVEDVVELFLDLTPARLLQLTEAAARRDPQVLRAIAHTLKGSAGTVGALAMQSAATDLEQSARDGDGASVDRVTRLAELFDRTGPALRALVAELRPLA